jgi:hypothetical protein
MSAIYTVSLARLLRLPDVPEGLAALRQVFGRSGISGLSMLVTAPHAEPGPSDPPAAVPEEDSLVEWYDDSLSDQPPVEPPDSQPVIVADQAEPTVQKLTLLLHTVGDVVISPPALEGLELLLTPDGVEVTLEWSYQQPPQVAIEMALPAFLVLPEAWIEHGKHIRDADGNVTGVERDPEAGPVRIKLGEATLRVSATGIEVTLESSGPLTLPPLIITGTDLALELKGLSIRTGDGDLPAELAARGPEGGFDENWRGVFASEITLWNLDRVFPGGPAGDADGQGGQITASHLAIDSRGLTGEIAWSRDPAADERLALDRVSLAFDRAWYPSGIEAGGRLALQDLNGQDIGFIARLELDPFAPANERWRLLLDAEGLVPGEPLAFFEVPSDASEPAIAAAAATLAGHLGDSDAALLLGALAAGQLAGLIHWRRVEIRSAQVTGRPGPSGAFAFDGWVSLTAEFDISVGDGEDPQRLSVSMGKVHLSYDPDSGAGSNWSLDDGLTLSLPLEAEVGGAVTLDRIGLRKRDEDTFLIELGLAMEGTGELAIGGLPNVVTFVYERGPPERFTVEVSRDGQPFMLLVPGVLYATGTLAQSDVAFPDLGGGDDWGKALRGALTVYLVGNGKAVAPAAHLQKESYLFALDLGLLTATRSDGMKALVLTGDLSFNPGIPIGTTGTALYGLGLTYGQNAAPNAQDGDYTGWFLSTGAHPGPAFSAHAKKWIPQADNWGFGASVAIGSQPDAGRAWNAAAGLFLLLPGPVVMITGKGNLFAPPPALPKGGVADGDMEKSAPFAAAVALDFLRKRLSAELVGDIQVGPDAAPLLKMYIPARIEASLSAPLDMELSVGRFSPVSERVSGRALGLYDITTYVMATTRGIENFPKAPTNLAPFAMAYGGSGGLSAGFASTLAELRLSVQAGFDLGVSLAKPPLMVGQIHAKGQLVARLVCVSVNLGIETKLLVVAPEPFELSGTADVRVGVPWPLPDFEFSGSFRIGNEARWPKDYPDADDPIQDISLFPRSNGTAVNEDGESFDGVVLSDQEITGVPVDTGILIGFRAPVGNEHPKIGSVDTQSDDMADKVWEIATTGTKNDQPEKLGWRHVLTKVSLREVATNIEVATLAGWSYRGVDGTTEHSANEAPGGQALRTSLKLLAPFEAAEERRFGTGAEVLADIVGSWQPCAQHPDPKDYEVIFAIPAPGELGIDTGMRRLPLLPPGRSGTLDRRSLVPGANATVAYTGTHGGATGFFAAHTLLPPGVFGRPDPLSFPLPGTLASQQFIITLPAMVFARQADAEAAKRLGGSFEPPCGRLEVSIPGGGSNRFAYFVVRRGVELLLFDQSNQAHEGRVPPQDGTIHISGDEVWELRRVSLGTETTVLRAHAVQIQALTPGLIGQYGAVFLGASFYAEQGEREASIERRLEASLEIVTKLGAQAADWASGGAEGLLKPATRYKLEVEVESHKTRQTGNTGPETAGEPKRQAKIVRFQTEKDIKQPLAPHRPVPAWAEDGEQNWNIKTVPDSLAFHYHGNDIKVQLADAVVAGRIAAHGRAVSLRLTHASGSTPEIRAVELLAKQKKKISKLQDIITDFVEGAECLSGGDPLSLTLTRRYNTLLEPGPYLADLVADAVTGERRDSVLLHRWRFTASQWMNLEDHLNAHVERDRARAVPRPGSASAVLSDAKSRIGAPVSEAVADDMLLDDLLTEAFGEPPKLPSDQPCVHLWVREDGVAGLMLDGPEPLLVPGVTAEFAGQGNVALHAAVSDVAGSRVLLVPRSIIHAGPLRVRIVAGNETHEIELTVPTFSDLTEGARA